MNMGSLKLNLSLFKMMVIGFLCYEAEETSLNLEGFDFSCVAVSRSPNSGESITGTARETRAYHG